MEDDNGNQKPKMTIGEIQEESAFRSQLIALNYQIGMAKDANRFDAMMSYQQKRDDLKMRVIERYGQLPAWWHLEK